MVKIEYKTFLGLVKQMSGCCDEIRMASLLTVPLLFLLLNTPNAGICLDR